MSYERWDLLMGSYVIGTLGCHNHSTMSVKSYTTYQG